MIHHVKIPLPKGGVLKIGNDLPLVFLLGPCQMESRAHALETSAALKEIGDTYGVGVVYKTSFDKANRSSIKTQRGLGLDEALPIFAEIRQTSGLPVMTDVHERANAAPVSGITRLCQICADCRSWRKQAIRSFSMPLIRFSSLAAKAKPAADNANSSPSLRAPPLPLALPRSLWKPTRTRIARPQMVPTWFR